VTDDPTDYVEQAKSRDTRFSILATSIAVEADLRDNETIKAIMAAIRADADRAMDEISDISPGDTVAISQHLVKIRSFVYLRRTLETILTRGRIAEQEIRAQDRMLSDDE
jgi:hypothetical protein